MKPIYKRYLKILLVLWGGASAALIVLYLFLLLPQNDMLKFSEEKLKKINIEYQQAKIANSDDVRNKQKVEIEKLNEKLNVFVADFNDIDNLTFSMSRIAGDIRLDSFSNRGSSDSESYSKIPTCEYIGYIDTAISFNSSFNKFARFINILERHSPIVFIDEFTISKSRDGDSKHKAELFLDFFVRIPTENTDE